MEEIKVENELKLCGVKRENLGKTLEKVKSQANDLLLFSLQWSDLDDYLKSAEGKVEKSFMELQSKSFALEERAKVVEAAEAEKDDLEIKSDLLRREIEDKEEELGILRNFVVEEQRSKKVQLNEMVESLRKIQVEIDLKGEKLAEMETDLERHRVVASAEMEHLDRTQTRSRELEEEIEITTKNLALVLDKIAECDKLLELKGEQLDDLERHNSELRAEMENLDRSQTRKSRELEEEIERKRKNLTAVLDEIAECGKQLELVEEQIDSQQKLLETRSSELVSKEMEQMVRSLNNKMEETCQEMESKAKELKHIEKLIEERSSHYESINLLIEEHTEELASKEKRQNEITEAIRKLSLDIASKEKTLERAKVFIQQLSEKKHSKEKKLESTKRHLERCIADIDSKKNELRSVKDTVRGCLQNLEIKEKELKSVQSLITERKKQTEEGEKKMQHLDDSIEELIRQLQAKGEEVCSINKVIRECSGELESKRKHRDQVQSSITDLTAELKSKECDLNSVKKKIQDCLKDFQSKEEQQVRLKASLMEREQELGLKEKELVAREERIDKKDQQLKSTEQKLAKCVKNYELKAKKLSSFCQQSKPDQYVDLVRDANVRDEKTLQLLLRGHLKKCPQLHLDVSRSLKASSDPAKLVLDTIQGLYSAHQRMAITNLDPNSVRRSSICLLECLMDMSPKLVTEVQEEAVTFATEWKNTTLVKAENPVEVLGTLHFLAAFSLAYTFDADKVQNLFDVAFLCKYAPSLFEALGISALAPVNNVLALDDKPEQQPPEAPINTSSDVQENIASSHLANEGGLRDHDGSASFSPNEVSTDLPLFKDPGRFVLNSVEEALMGAHQRGELGLAEPIVKALVPLLEELTRVVRSTDTDLQSDATKVAHRWSWMMGTSARISPLEAWGFLQFIVAYGLVKQTNQDETLQFASYVAHFKQAPNLFQYLGLNYAIPNFVKQLLNEHKYIQAIRFIFSFNLKTKFSPLEFLKEEIINLRRSANEKKTFESQAEDGDAGKLRDIIELIEDFKLEIYLPVDIIVKFMVPREFQNQNQCVVSSSVPVHPPHVIPRFLMASHTVIHSSDIATHASNLSHPTSLRASPNPLVLDVETYQASGSNAFQGQYSHHAGFKRPRVDPQGPRSTVRPCFNPPSGYGRF